MSHFRCGFVLALACGALALSPPGAWARGGWGDISTVYCFEADEGQGAYVNTDNTLGNLDGEWRRSNNSDEWDGSTPEPGDGQPGGIGVEILAGEAEGGGDASVLSIEDVVTSGADFNNRKLFLWRDTSTELDLAGGVTIIARWRLNPEPLSVEFTNNGGTIPVPNGSYLHNDNKGQLGFVQRTAVGGALTAGLMVAITDEGNLQFAQAYAGGPCAGTFYPAEYCVDVDEENWVTLWMALQEEAGGIRALLYINGDVDPVVDGVLTNVNANTEDATLPESGGVATSYLMMAQGATNQTGAIQIDYLCAVDGFFEPNVEVSGCPAGLRATAQGRDVKLEWTNDPSKLPTGVNVFRDGTQIATGAPAEPAVYTDVDVPPGAHSYELRFTVPGSVCSPLTADISTCPTGLSAVPTAGGVLLRWQNEATYPGLSVSRDGTEIAAGLPGDSTSYLDATAPAGTLTYSLTPTAGTCNAIEVTVLYVDANIEAGDFGSESVDWTYALDPPADATAEEYLQHDPTASVIGDLDGAWSSGSGSDSWDGSAPGKSGDPALDVENVEDPASAAPGGIGLVTDGDIGAYLFEDVGDPRTAVPPATVGWLDPSNRKLFLAYDVQQTVEDSNSRSLLTDGLTLRARLRLTPADRVVDVASAPNGYPTQNDGKGMVTFMHDAGTTASGASQRLGLALDVSPDAPGTGILYLGDAGGLDAGGNATEIIIPVPDPTQWLDIWLTVEDPDPLTPEVDLKVYFNGSTTPGYETEAFVLNDNGSEGPVSNGTTPGNSLYLGLNSTPDDGSMELDLVAFFDGVVAPGGVVLEEFHRGDSNADGVMNITDGIFVLNFLFLGGPAPPCTESANANDDNTLNITDGIFILNFLFLGGPGPADPGPPGSPCGPDPAASVIDLGCATYNPCAG